MLRYQKRIRSPITLRVNYSAWYAQYDVRSCAAALICERERGFSAQNRIKSKTRNDLSVERLEFSMRYSLLHKQQGANLTAQSPNDALSEAAVIFGVELLIGIVCRRK